MALLSHFMGTRVLTAGLDNARLYIQVSRVVIIDYKALFEFMTELTTGVLFLMTSLYGGGQADAHVANVINADNYQKQENVETIRKSEIFTTNDPKTMENYLRQVYANDPILIEIARCESNYRHYDKDGVILKGKVDSADVGVMQINERYHADTAEKLGLDLRTIPGNIAYAKYLYEKEGTKPWSASKPCWSIGNTVAKK